MTHRKARKGRGKRKGGRYERSLCKRLSLWWSELEREDLFDRSSGSGSSATVNSRRGKQMTQRAGDISANGREGSSLLALFTVEAKHYKNLAVAQVVFRGTGKLVEFWKQTRKQTQPGRAPMLVACQDRQPELLVTNTDGADMLERTAGRRLRIAVLPRLDAQVIPFADVLLHVPARTLRSNNKDRIKLTLAADRAHGKKRRTHHE